MDKLRVLYYIDSYGNSSFVETQIQGVSSNVEVHILCSRFFSNPQSEQLKEKGKITVVAYTEPLWVSKIRQRLEFSDIFFNYYNPLFSKKVTRVIEEFNPNIIHCQFGYDALVLYDNYFRRDKKVVVTFRGYDASLKLILKTYRKKLSKFLSKPNVYPLFVSESLRLNLLKHNIPFNKINNVIYSNVDTSFYARKSYEHSRHTLIFTQVSNFRQKKGHHYTIKSFEYFFSKHPNIDFKLIFIGAIDAECSALIEQVRNSPIFNRIVFRGLQTASEIRDQLELSHFFVHNSITTEFNDQEGIPNTIMEAMAMELPILTTRHSGITELNDNNVDIFYSDEKDIEGYYNNILKALKFNTYSQMNQSRIKKSFSGDRFVSELTEFYKIVGNAA